MFREIYALVGFGLALTTASALAQEPSYEGRGYGGPLYVGPNFQQGGQWSPPTYGAGRERSYTTERYSAPERIDRVQRKRIKDDDDDVKTAKRTPANKEDSPKTDLAKRDIGKPHNESSTIASVASTATAKADPVKADATKIDTEGSGKPVVCKRYFPTVGQTITVPCD